jgi:glyoxylase I family protein
MSLVRLHHVNLSSAVVPRMDEFYRHVLELDGLQGGTADNRMMTDDGYTAPVSFFKSGDTEFHLATTDLDLNFRLQHSINPLISGHIAFRTQDIERVKQRLAQKGINYSDYGVWSINDWYQIFFHDPAGNVIEVHQDLSQK